MLDGKWKGIEDEETGKRFTDRGPDDERVESLDESVITTQK
jgi:hypothetical protein